MAFGKKKTDGKNSFSGYKDVSGEFTNKMFKRAYWIVTHKIFLRNLLISSLIFWCVITLGYSIFVWVKYFTIDYFEDETMRAQQTVDLPDYTGIHVTYAAKKLKFSGTNMFKSAEGKYDFVTTVQNPNARFLATVTYHYSYSGEKTASFSTIILPKKENILAVLGEKVERSPSRGRLVIEHINWQRISNHTIPDIEKHMEARLQFLVDDFDVVYTRAGSKTVPTVEFSITNASYYSFWEPQFYVELLKGNNTAAVLPLFVNKFMSEETRTFELHPIIPIKNITNIRVLPNVNIFDTTTFME